VVGKVFDDVGVEPENAELVCTDDPGQELHYENLVVEGEALVVAHKHIVETFCESLGVVQQLEGGKIGGIGVLFFAAFLRQKISDTQI
jgi:hypothetical protein